MPRKQVICPCNPCCSWKNNEATAWSLDSAARGCIIISGIFLGTALLHSAKVSAGCTFYTDVNHYNNHQNGLSDNFTFLAGDCLRVDGTNTCKSDGYLGSSEYACHAAFVVDGLDVIPAIFKDDVVSLGCSATHKGKLDVTGKIITFEGADVSRSTASVALSPFPEGTSIVLTSSWDGEAEPCSTTYKCADIDIPGSFCSEDNTVLGGLKPKSILTNMAAVTGLLTALTMPIIGAIVDHTKYRWDVGAWTAFLLIFINGIQICVGPSTWFFVALLQVAAGYLYTCHSVVTYAYMPELTSNKDELAVMASSFNMWQFFAETVYLLVVVVVSIVGSLDDITAAKFSQTMICLISLVLLGFSWIYLFGPRPALHEVPSGSSLVRVGFTRMRTTYNELKADFGEIRKFLLAMAFAEAGASAFASIAITYLVEVLGMESSETGIVFLTTLMFGVPGSLWARHLMLKVGTEKAYKGALMWWGTVTCLAPFFMNKPEQSGNAYIIGILWGIGFGWLYPTQRTTYCLLIPGGQESELMGLYIFAGQIIVWFPPLMFSILVTNNIPMPYGLGLCCGLFFYIALVITMFIDFESGFDKAKESVHLRQMGEDAGGSGSTGELEAGESAAAKLGPKPDRNSSNML